MCGAWSHTSDRGTTHPALLLKGEKTQTLSKADGLLTCVTAVQSLAGLFGKSVDLFLTEKVVARSGRSVAVFD